MEMNKVEKDLIKSYLKEIDELTLPLYLRDQDKYIKMAGEAWCRHQCNKYIYQIKDTKREKAKAFRGFANHISQNMISVEVGAYKGNRDRWLCAVTFLTLEEAFNKTSKWKCKRKSITILNKLGEETDYRVFEEQEFLGEAIFNAFIKINGKKVPFKYHLVDDGTVDRYYEELYGD